MSIQNVIKTIFGVAVTGLAITSCTQPDEFTIKGTINGAEKSTLYLSSVEIGSHQYIDSVRLDKSGTFRFSHQRPECFDFYRLQLDKKGPQITISIDSTETVTVTTDAKNFADSCKIDGSEESVKIMQLTQLEKALSAQVNRLIDSASPAVGRTREKIQSIVDEFKTNICKEYIAPAPGKASAYYALFLRLNNVLLFDPMHNRFDSRCFSAVATSLNMTHPHTTKAMHIYNVAYKGMRATQPASRDTIHIETESKSNTALFDIKLPNIDGDSISLSSLKGKVVMLDFTAYSNAQLSARNIGLRDIYSKYKDEGFEIYQISYDYDEHFWKTSADNLPWTCVRDGEGLSSYNITLYRISQIPTFFLINRANEIVMRDVQVEDLEKSIKNLLKEK